MKLMTSSDILYILRLFIFHLCGTMSYAFLFIIIIIIIIIYSFSFSYEC